MLLGVTKQAAFEKDSSAYCLRNETQLLCVCGDSKACQIRREKKILKLIIVYREDFRVDNHKRTTKGS